MVNVTRAELATRRRRPRPRRERDVQAAILQSLATLPHVVAWRQNTGAVKEGKRFIRFGVRGLPDIVGWVTTPVTLLTPNAPAQRQRSRAYMLLIECKAPGKKLSAHQQAFRELAERDGVLYILATSVDDVLAALR